MVGNLRRRQLPTGLVFLKNWGAQIGLGCALVGMALGEAIFDVGGGLILAATALRLINVLLGNEPLAPQPRRRRRGAH